MTDLTIRPADVPESADILALIRELTAVEEFPFPVTVTEELLIFRTQDGSLRELAETLA